MTGYRIALDVRDKNDQIAVRVWTDGVIYLSPILDAKTCARMLYEYIFESIRATRFECDVKNPFIEIRNRQSRITVMCDNTLTVCGEYDEKVLACFMYLAAMIDIDDFND